MKMNCVAHNNAFVSTWCSLLNGSVHCLDRLPAPHRHICFAQIQEIYMCLHVGKKMEPSKNTLHGQKENSQIPKCTASIGVHI